MQGSADSSEPSEPSGVPRPDGGADAADAWDASAADDEALRDEGERAAEATAVTEIIPDLAPAGEMVSDADGAAGARLAALLSSLRALPGPCAPPIGEGAFDILYASAREIVVWFVSAKDGVGQKEVAIPTRLAREAWEMLRRGDPVDEAALRAITSGASGASWLLALFAQLPSIEVRSSAANGEAGGDGHAITLLWRGDEAPHTPA